MIALAAVLAISCFSEPYQQVQRPIIPVCAKTLVGFPSLTKEDQTQFQDTLDKSLVEALAIFSQALPTYAIERLEYRFIDKAQAETNIPPPKPESPWTAAELRTLCANLNVRYGVQLSIDTWSVKTLGIGTAAGTYACQVKGRMWFCDTNLKPGSAGEYRAVEATRYLDNDDIARYVSQGIDIKPAIVKLAIGDFCRTAVGRAFSGLLPKR